MGSRVRRRTKVRQDGSSIDPLCCLISEGGVFSLWRTIQSLPPELGLRKLFYAAPFTIGIITSPTLYYGLNGKKSNHKLLYVLQIDIAAPLMDRLPARSRGRVFGSRWNCRLTYFRFNDLVLHDLEYWQGLLKLW